MLVAIATVAVGIAFSFRVQSTPDYREGLVATRRPLSLNPLVTGGDRAARDVGRLLYRGLLKLDDQARPVPDLARAMDISSDGFTYTLSLPDGLTWSDGRPLTGADVAATIAYVQAPNLADPEVALPWRGVRAALTAPGSLRLTLPSPRSAFATTLAALPILPLGQLEPGALFSLPREVDRPLATSGPYRVLSSTPTALRLEANPHSPDRPQLGRLELDLFPDFEEAARSLATGDVDAVVGTTAGQLARLGSLPHTRLERSVTYRFVDLVFNERVAGLDDPAVRHAMSLAVDRQRLVDGAVAGAGEPQSRAIPAGIRWAADPASPGPDVAGARSQLDSAGWTPGPDGIRARGGTRLAFDLTVADSSPLPEAAREVAGQMAAFGISLGVRTVPAASFAQAVLNPRYFRVALADWDGGPDPDVSSFWRSNATPPSGYNLSGAQPDPFLDQALDTLATTTGERSRRDAAEHVEGLIADSAPAVFLYAPSEAVAIRDSVTNAPLPGTGGAAARFTAIASWSHGEPRGEGRSDLAVLLAAGGIIISVAAVLFTGVRLAGRLLPAESSSPLERAVVGLMIDVVQVVAVLQLLGALHLLWPVAVMAAHVLVAAIVVARVPAPQGEFEPWRLPTRGWLAVIAAAIPFGSLALVQGFRSPSGEYQTRRFHAANAAHWLQAHTTWSLPFAAPGDATTSTAAGNTDLLALWAMLPTHTDELAYAANAVFAIICTISAAIIARELGASAWKGALAAVLVLTAPISMLTQVRSLLPDVAVTAGILFAIAMILCGRLHPESRCWGALAGLGLGLAVGSQLGAAIPAAGVIVWSLAVTRRHRFRTGGLLLAGTAALAGFWLLRNWVATGNPVYPIPVILGGATIFGGGPDLLAVYSTPLLSQLVTVHLAAIARWIVALWQLFGLGMVVLLVIGFPLAVARLLWRRPGALITAALVPLLGVAYALTPGTGGGPGGDLELIAGALRHTFPAAVLAVVLCATVLGTRAWLIISAAVLLYNGAIVVGSPTRPDLGVTPPLLLVVAMAGAALAAGTLLAGQLVSWWRGLARWQAAVSGGAAAVIVGGGMAVLLRFTEEPSMTPLTRVLAETSRPQGTVVVLHDADVRSVLGARLDVDIAAAGQGAPGSQSPIAGAPALTSRIQELAPAAVVVGTDGVDPLPPGWRPPGWRQVATLERGARVYLP